MNDLNDKVLAEVSGFALTNSLVATLPEAALDYLLAYGFKQSLTDAIAGRAKKLADEGKSVSEVEEALNAILARRFDAIVSGTIGTRGNGAPRLTGLEKIKHDLAVKMLKAAVTAKGAKWPKQDDEGKAWVAERVEALLAHPKHGPKIEAEAQEELKRQKALAGAELDLDLDF